MKWGLMKWGISSASQKKQDEEVPPKN